MASKPPRLTFRIAAYTSAALLVAAGAILWFVNERATAQAESQAAEQTQFIADVLLRDELTSTDFAKPVTGARRRQLDEVFDRAVRGKGIVRMSLIAASGLITYSTDPPLIGQAPALEGRHAEEALRGRGLREVGEVRVGDRRVKVLETYLPVNTRGAGRALGVFELFEDYNSGIVGNARKTVLPVAGFLLVALLLLLAVLVPILRRVTAAVEVRNRRLVEQAATLERSLAVAQEARTEAESARRALTEQNKRLRELDRLKDEFLSLVSHELRTPLTSIRGYLDLVLDEEAGELTSEQRRFLDAVERNSGRLLRLVGDRGRLAQVLDNLVSNALKFTREGGAVTVRTSSEGEHVAVEVSDTGIGIALEDQPKLFERFFRSKAAAEEAIPGTGLGLAIVKAIVEAHGGRITVDSKEGRGTTFRVELPLLARSEPVEAMEAAA